MGGGRKVAGYSSHHEAIADEPGKVNEDPLGDAWFFKMKASDLSPMDDYMDEAGYKKFIG